MSSSERLSNSSDLPVSSTSATSSTNNSVQRAAASAAGQDVTAQGQTGAGTVEHTKGQAEKAAEKLYEERIEDEYAKREGGA